MTDRSEALKAIAGAQDNWEVGPCVDRLGRVTSWDISIKPEPGARGVAVIASVYSGEETARAILAAVQMVATEERRAALTRMVQMDEEMGLYDSDEEVAASPNTRPAASPPERTEELVERDISGETVCGFRVAAWRETHPEHGDKYGHSYSEHWSTPNTRDPRVKVERLFTEEQLRAALQSLGYAEMERALEGLLDAVLAVHAAQGRIVVDPHAVAEASTILAALRGAPAARKG